MDRLAAMRTFVEIVDGGSLTAAAAARGRSLPTVVRTLASLERHLGARLLRRTTRRMTLTAEGRDYLQRCRRILADVEEAELAPLQRHVAWFGLLGPHSAETADGYLPPVVEPFWKAIEGAVPPVKRAMVFDLQTYLTLDYFKSQQRAFEAYYAENRVLAVTIYFLVYIAVTGLSLPGAAVLTLIGGALFGLGLGLVLISFASSIGATLAFLVSRFLLRDYVQRHGPLDDGSVLGLDLRNPESIRTALRPR